MSKSLLREALDLCGEDDDIVQKSGIIKKL